MLGTSIVKKRERNVYTNKIDIQTRKTCLTMVDLFNCHVKTINTTGLFYIKYSNVIWFKFVQIQNSSQNCTSINIITLHNYSVYKLPSYFHAFTFSLDLKITNK